MYYPQCLPKLSAIKLPLINVSLDYHSAEMVGHLELWLYYTYPLAIWPIFIVASPFSLQCNSRIYHKSLNGSEAAFWSWSSITPRTLVWYPIVLLMFCGFCGLQRFGWNLYHLKRNKIGLLTTLALFGFVCASLKKTVGSLYQVHIGMRYA